MGRPTYKPSWKVGDRVIHKESGVTTITAREALPDGHHPDSYDWCYRMAADAKLEHMLGHDVWHYDSEFKRA